MVPLSEAGEQIDCRLQIEKLQGFLAGWGDKVRTFENGAGQPDELRFRPAARSAGQPSVVVGEAVGAELGRPGSQSHVMVLNTAETSLVSDGRVRVVGDDLRSVGRGKDLSFAQIAILSHPPGRLPDPFEALSTCYLANRLPGYMARSVPGRLWVRFDRKLLDEGFGLEDLGRALLEAYRMDFDDLLAVEIVLLAGDAGAVAALDTIAAEAKVLSGRHRKLALSADGTFECSDLDCENCDERETCDALKDVTIKYRKGVLGT